MNLAWLHILSLAVLWLSLKLFGFGVNALLALGNAQGFLSDDFTHGALNFTRN